MVGPPTSASPSEVDAAGAVRALGWSGVALPEIVLVGCRLIPVVAMDAAAHRARERSGDGPNLDTDVLVTWEWLQSAAHAPPTTLRLRGVLVVARRGWRRALHQARSVRGFGPTGVLVAPCAFDDEECRLEFAVHGVGLVPWGPHAGRVIMSEQATGPRKPADRWVEELLYRHALDHGWCPPV